MAGTGSQTRTRLLEVAERLFAERGVEAVSLRLVGQQAGQRNNSVAQYHFGSRDGLVAAIIEHRSAAIEARRRALLEEYRDQPSDVSGLLDLFIRPLAESAGTVEHPTYYLRFLARLVEQDGARAAQQLTARPTGIQLIHRELRHLLPDVPARTFARRLRWTTQVSLRVLADHERETVAGRRGAASLEEVLADLRVALEALLRAPSATARTPA